MGELEIRTLAKEALKSGSLPWPFVMERTRIVSGGDGEDSAMDAAEEMDAAD